MITSLPIGLLLKRWAVYDGIGTSYQSYQIVMTKIPLYYPLHLVKDKEGHIVNNISVAGEDEGRKRHDGAVSSS